MNRAKRKNTSPKSNQLSLRTVQLLLDAATMEMAIKLGDGELCLGIRRAVVLASKPVKSMPVRRRTAVCVSEKGRITAGRQRH